MSSHAMLHTNRVRCEKKGRKKIEAALKEIQNAASWDLRNSDRSYSGGGGEKREEKRGGKRTLKKKEKEKESEDRLHNPV